MLASQPSTKLFYHRLQLVKLVLFGFSILLLARLFFWQVISSDSLVRAGQKQREQITLLSANRGSIQTSDGFELVSNKPQYTLFAYKPQLTTDPNDLSQELAAILIESQPQDATQAAIPQSQRLQSLKLDLHARLTDPDRDWVPLARNLDKDSKQKLESLSVEGLGFDEHFTRFYPEASMSAHLVGFVGHDNSGQPTGYFGLEGNYNLELRGSPGILAQDTDATGLPLLLGKFNLAPVRKGRTLKLHLDRSIQFLLETNLKLGLEKYQAKQAQAIVMEPHTGAILAMASFPNYDPSTFNQFDPTLYKNPIIADTYEPGSTFKVIVTAAALEENLVKADTTCDQPCQGPVRIGQYTINTWDHQYHPGQTVTDIIKHSDNTGMVFIGQKLGLENFLTYLERFGFTNETGIDLQEEARPNYRQKWTQLDLATASFGQGIAVTGIQMLNAVAAIANGGTLMTPQVVDAVIDQKEIDIQPQPIRRVISPKTADLVTDIMVQAAHEGEARWAVLKDYQIAGKTGTAQIPIQGHYDQDKTIASFVGFAPADNPRFAMLIKLTEPESSPWASETAAPLWFSTANDILRLLNVPPNGN